jgi:hypothetical protein
MSQFFKINRQAETISLEVFIFSTLTEPLLSKIEFVVFARASLEQISSCAYRLQKVVVVVVVHLDWALESVANLEMTKNKPVDVKYARDMN